MKEVDVLIIGAGAAGLMCAIEAGKRGRKALVIDHANKPGKKILMSGGGRCNFTNTGTTPENFISRNPHFCKSALSRYTPQDFIDLVEKHHIPYHEKTLGQLFCDNKAKDILNMLLAECANVGSNVQMGTTIHSIKPGYTVKTSLGDIKCESLVIATGGLSIPTMGASPLGYKLAEQFGINVWPTSAGLVPFTLHEKDKMHFAELPGVSADCIATANNTSFREAMLFTHRGLSGPSILQISSYWQPGDTLSIKLIPEVDILADLKSLNQQAPKKLLKQYFNEHLPKRVVSTFLEDEDKPIGSCSFKELETIAAQFQQWEIKPNGTEGYRTAEVTLGGVDTNAVSSKTFEAKEQAGLYFIGEVLDVTGWLGGYNFQWAWASGWCAGQVA